MAMEQRIARQPDCRVAAEAELMDDSVAPMVKAIAYDGRVIATWDIVFQLFDICLRKILFSLKSNRRVETGRPMTCRANDR